MKFGLFAGYSLKTRLGQGRWQHRLPRLGFSNGLGRPSFPLADSHRTAYFRRTFGVLLAYLPAESAVADHPATACLAPPFHVGKNSGKIAASCFRTRTYDQTELWLPCGNLTRNMALSNRNSTFTGWKRNELVPAASIRSLCDFRLKGHAIHEWSGISNCCAVTCSHRDSPLHVDARTR